MNPYLQFERRADTCKYLSSSGAAKKPAPVSPHPLPSTYSSVSFQIMLPQNIEGLFYDHPAVQFAQILVNMSLSIVCMIIHVQIRSHSGSQMSNSAFRFIHFLGAITRPPSLFRNAPHQEKEEFAIIRSLQYVIRNISHDDLLPVL